MAIKDSLLPEFDHEMATTRKLLERLPDEALDWKPHEKSMTLRQLSGHLATIPQWGLTIAKEDFFDLAGGGGNPVPTMESRAQILGAFDKSVGAAREMIAAKSDGELMAPWSLKRAGQEIFTLPRVAALRSFLMNHSIHHRGQLSVYLRLQNVPIPSIYGPSADEGSF